MQTKIFATLQALMRVDFVVITISTLIVLTYGLESLNLMQVFDSDEHRIVSMVLHHLQVGNLNPDGYFNYGHLYESIGFAGLKFFSHFDWNVDIRLIGTWLRLLSLGFGALTCLMTYRLALTLGLARPLAVLSVLLLFTMPDFVFYLRTIHPDTLQTFLMVASMVVATSRHTFRAALLSAMLAGLAFGTKYSGVFILPFCLLPHALAYWTGTEGKSGEKLLNLVKKAILVGVAFFALYAITNPYAVRHYRAAIGAIQFEQNHVATGHGKVEPTNPLLWFSPMSYEFSALGLVLLGLGFLFCGLTVASPLRRKSLRAVVSDYDSRNVLSLFIYAAFSIAYLLVSVRMREPRYTFHIVPFAMILSVRGLRSLLSGVERRLALPPAVALVGLGALFCTHQTYRAVERMVYANRKPVSARVVAGGFLEDRYPAKTKILADYYTYIPAKFTAVEIEWGITQEQIDKFAPDVIIFNRSMSGRWLWKEGGTKFADMKWAHDKSYGKVPDEKDAFFRSLLADGSWTVVYDTEDELVLERSAKTGRSPFARR